jgi:hypothetical protein
VTTLYKRQNVSHEILNFFSDIAKTIFGTFGGILVRKYFFDNKSSSNWNLLKQIPDVNRSMYSLLSLGTQIQISIELWELLSSTIRLILAYIRWTVPDAAYLRLCVDDAINVHITCAA